MLRSSLLFHEVKRRINTKVPFIVGDSFKYSELNVDYSNDELADYLRKTTYLLNKKNLKRVFQLLTLRLSQMINLFQHT